MGVVYLFGNNKPFGQTNEDMRVEAVFMMYAVQNMLLLGGPEWDRGQGGGSEVFTFPYIEIAAPVTTDEEKVRTVPSLLDIVAQGRKELFMPMSRPAFEDPQILTDSQLSFEPDFPHDKKRVLFVGVRMSSLGAKLGPEKYPGQMLVRSWDEFRLRTKFIQKHYPELYEIAQRALYRACTRKNKLFGWTVPEAVTREVNSQERIHTRSSSRPL